MFDAVQRILPNGIRLTTVRNNTRISALHIGIKIGSMYESEGNRGISHFIEHMLFKGTFKRSNEKLNEDLENLGGEYNAYTNYDCTVYSSTNLSEELENSIEIMSDMIMNPSFKEDEIQKEKKVINSEIRASVDDMEQFSFRQINKMAFRNSPLRYDTCGSENSIKNFSRKDLVSFHDMYYVPNNCFISIVSDYDHDTVYNLVLKYFKEWNFKKFSRNKVSFERNIPDRKDEYRRDIEQSSVMFLFTLYGLDKKQELALRILNHKLGESPNSILFRKLREEKGLAYDVYTDLDLTNNIKTLYIYTAVDEKNIEIAIETVLKCIEDVKNEKIVFDGSTISLMKKSLKTSVVFTLEDSTDIGEYVLVQSMEGEDIFKFNYDIKAMDEITQDDLYDVSRKVFDNPTVYVLRKAL